MVFQSIQHLTIQLLKNFGKSLYNLLNNKKNITFRSRKTLPCTKGIKTHKHCIARPSPRVERHCPVRKGLRQSDLLESIET